MALTVKKVDIWAAPIEDRAGGAAAKVAPLSAAGANFEWVFARRTPESPGRGLLLVAPVKGAKVVRAAAEAGFAKAPGVFGLRVEGTDKPGIGAQILKSLGGAGISFRGLSAMAIGRKFVTYLALDSADDVAKASSLLRKLG